MTYKFHQPSQNPVRQFDVFLAFANLDTSRKLALCDQLYHNGAFAFKAMVEKMWPSVTETDVAKLQNLLRSRIDRIFNQ